MSGEQTRRITLIEREDYWVAIDEATSVGGQGPTREAALAELDDAVALQEGEAIGSLDEEAEAAVLRDIGIDPESVDGDRELPEFMQ
jgi:predicted RNase H-like HicB family nuclease